MDSVVPRAPKAQPIKFDGDTYRRRLALASTPQAILAIDREIDAVETVMRRSGLYSTEEIRPVIELHMRARWQLGRALAQIERGPGARTDLTSSRAGTRFRDYLRELELDKNRAMEAQRIGTLPEPELEKALAYAHQHDILCTFAELIDWARPYWYQAQRQRRHENIAARAIEAAAPGIVGPFPLIYADPPWEFATYSEMGAERTPTQHYPTLTDDEIKHFAVGGRGVRELAHRDAALLLWCTSSNVHRALAVMDDWGFTFTSSGAWVKLKADGTPIGGLGLVFRNMHELLLYGVRGNMPGPQYQPPSVFFAQRGEHSAKPLEIRAAIERMYPDFDARTRLELFARDESPGWSSHGFEAHDYRV